MDVRQITAALKRVFNEEHVRIVFWNDPDREFVGSLPDIAVEGVEILKLDEIGSLEAKVRIELDDPDGRFLLYSPAEEPDYENDWLLDMRLYGRNFRADRASIVLRELALTQQHLRQHLEKRRKFFDSKERLQKLKSLVSPEDTEVDLDRKMLAVIARADQPELFNIVRTLFHAMARDDEPDLEADPAAWAQIERFELDEPFWAMVKSDFGYGDDGPTLKNLLIRLLVSDYAHHLARELPVPLRHLQLPRSGITNAVVCLDQWRDSSSKSSSYNVLAGEVGALLDMPDHLPGCEVEELVEVMTFVDVEKTIVQGLLDRVTSAPESIAPEFVGGIVARRQAGHWVSSVSLPEAQRNARRAVYEALAVAAQFLDLSNKHEAGFDFPDMAAMYRGYEAGLFRFDQLYRRFCENADVAADQGWDMLKPLREEIEACYCHGYLTRLALAWGKFVTAELPGRWAIDDVQHQYRFFDRYVGQWLNEADNRRAFVIVSDAMRYEAAEELTGYLNGMYRIQAELSSQLGVLPSYTALGMASLLPHSKLEHTEMGNVLADGQQTSSLEQRNEILSTVNGMAVKADQLLAMKKEVGREFIAGERLVYIYHDEIDARGDKFATEGDTFEAVRKTIRELADLVRYVVNNLNGNYVLITADHGFLFTETAPGDPEKSKLEEKPDGTVIAKKRYLLGHDLPDHEHAWRGDTAVTAGAEGGMQFWVPKGANRFHFTSGARFVHGGAMLQEIVVPVIEVKHLKDKGRRERTRSKRVAVQVLGTKHRITARRHRFTLLQMQPVGERADAVTLRVAVYEGDEPVTTIESVTFDSMSSNLDERQKSVILTLRDRPYDKRTPYRLILRDAGTGIEQESLDVIIDRGITDDF